MTEKLESVPPTRILLWTSLFAVFVAVQVIRYPALATDVHGLFGAPEGPGSSMGYFRYSYVIPAAIVLVAVAAAARILAGRRSRRSFYWALGFLFLFDLLMLVVSAQWYFQTIRKASEYTG